MAKATQTMKVDALGWCSIEAHNLIWRLETWQLLKCGFAAGFHSLHAAIDPEEVMPSPLSGF